jgi:RNA polymerase sigma factor (sigma-70 family)
VAFIPFVTDLIKKNAFFEKKIVPLKPTDTRKQSPSLQDDLALQLFLRNDRDHTALHAFYETARRRLAEAEGPELNADRCKHWITLAVATLLDDLNTAPTVKNDLAQQSSSPVQGLSSLLEMNEREPSRMGRSHLTFHLWSRLVIYYGLARGAEADGYFDKSKLNYPYFSRDVLLRCLQKNKPLTLDILSTAYRKPTSRLLDALPIAGFINFEDAYQEALINLAEKIFPPDHLHTAQLFSIFFTMVKFRAIDQARVIGRRIRSDDKYAKIHTPERHDYPSYNDYIIETKGLNEKFGSDNASKVLETALGNISKECRKLLWLLFYQGYSYDKVAALTGFKVNGIGTRRKRCLKNLGDQINPDQPLAA